MSENQNNIHYQEQDKNQNLINNENFNQIEKPGFINDSNDIYQNPAPPTQYININEIQNFPINDENQNFITKGDSNNFQKYNQQNSPTNNNTPQTINNSNIINTNNFQTNNVNIPEPYINVQSNEPIVINQYYNNNIQMPNNGPLINPQMDYRAQNPPQNGVHQSNSNNNTEWCCCICGGMCAVCLGSVCIIGVIIFGLILNGIISFLEALRTLDNGK